jgi:hypothetical protein
MKKQISRRHFLKLTGLALIAGGLVSKVQASESAQSPARERWNKLSEDEKQKLRKKWQAFKSLPPERQEKIRENYRKFRSLSPERQERVKTRIRKFKSLPPERRQEVRQKWRARRKNRVRRERSSR